MTLGRAGGFRRGRRRRRARRGRRAGRGRRGCRRRPRPSRPGREAPWRSLLPERPISTPIAHRQQQRADARDQRAVDRHARAPRRAARRWAPRRERSAAVRSATARARGPRRCAALHAVALVRRHRRRHTPGTARGSRRPSRGAPLWSPARRGRGPPARWSPAPGASGDVRSESPRRSDAGSTAGSNCPVLSARFHGFGVPGMWPQGQTVSGQRAGPMSHGEYAAGAVNIL